MTAAVPGPRFRDQLAEAIATVEFSRQTHVEWAAHLRRHAEVQPPAVGDAEYHERAVREYDNVLIVLRRFAEIGRCPGIEPCAHFRAAIGATIAGERARVQTAANQRAAEALAEVATRVWAACDELGQPEYRSRHYSAGVRDAVRRVRRELQGISVLTLTQPAPGRAEQ